MTLATTMLPPPRPGRTSGGFVWRQACRSPRTEHPPQATGRQGRRQSPRATPKPTSRVSNGANPKIHTPPVDLSTWPGVVLNMCTYLHSTQATYYVAVWSSHSRCFGPGRHLITMHRRRRQGKPTSQPRLLTASRLLLPPPQSNKRTLAEDLQRQRLHDG